MNRLDPIRLGLSAGTVLGLSWFVTTLFCVLTGYAKLYLIMIAALCPGFEISVWGSLLGFTYGLGAGFFSFYLLGWVYNLLGPRQT